MGATIADFNKQGELVYKNNDSTLEHIPADSAIPAKFTEILYPCEFLDPETSSSHQQGYLFQMRLKEIRKKMLVDPRIKVVRLEYLVDGYLNLCLPVEDKDYHYKFANI